MTVHRDEVTRPQQRQRLVLETHAPHDLGDVLVKLGPQIRVQRLVRRVERVLRDAAHRRHAAARRLLVDDREQRVLHHLHPHLALLDARQQPLVDELPAGLLASLEVLAREGRFPRAGLGRRPVHAELEELAHRVVLDVVVVHLHQLELVVIIELCVAQILAVGLILEPDEPDALSGRAAVLLDHARLEGGEGLEALLELLRSIVRRRVGQAAREVLDGDQRVLGAELRLHGRRRPHRHALGDRRHHERVEFLLRARDDPRR